VSLSFYTGVRVSTRRPYVVFSAESSAKLYEVRFEEGGEVARFIDCRPVDEFPRNSSLCRDLEAAVRLHGKAVEALFAATRGLDAFEALQGEPARTVWWALREAMNPPA